MKKSTNRLHPINAVAIITGVGSLLIISLFVVGAILLRNQSGPVSANGSAIFSQTSFWNTPLPRFTPEDSSFRPILQGVLPATQVTSGARMYTVPANAATVTVELKDCTTGVIIGPIPKWLNVPIPVGASAGANNEMIVYQPSSLTVWEFGDMQQVAGQWQACSGGRIEQTNASNGVYSLPYGLTLSGLSRSGGQIAQAEMQANRINHVIGLSLPSVGGAVWPASNGGNGTVPAGTRLQLDPTIDISSLSLTPLARAIAEAAQTYGFVVWDLAPTPTVHIDGDVAALANFPWDRVKALPPAYGKTGIQPQISSFSVSSTGIKTGESVEFTWAANNVDACTVPGIFSNQPAVGQFRSTPLTYSTTFSLVCGGVAGSASREITVTVPFADNNPEPPGLAEGIVITPPPVAGKLNVLPEFLPLSDLERVYKVEYFETARLIDIAAEAPYDFDTTQVANGEHQLELKIYYRGGDLVTKSRRVKVANGEEQLRFAAVSPPPNRTPEQLITAGAGLLLLLLMVAATVYGRRLARIK